MSCLQSWNDISQLGGEGVVVGVVVVGVYAACFPPRAAIMKNKTGKSILPQANSLYPRYLFLRSG